MNSKIVKLDAPYQVVYAGGRIGRHIATLITWPDDPEGKGEVFGAHQYPILDEGNEFAAGTLAETDLEDCRVVCPISKETGLPATNLYWLASIIEFDLQQLEPVGISYIGERMQILECSVAFPNDPQKKCDDGSPMPQMEFDICLSIFSPQGSWEDNRQYRVRSNKAGGFYFEASGTAEEVYRDLDSQRAEYFGLFSDQLISIRFHTNDMELDDVIDRLNEHANCP